MKPPRLKEVFASPAQPWGQNFSPMFVPSPLLFVCMCLFVCWHALGWMFVCSFVCLLLCACWFGCLFAFCVCARFVVCAFVCLLLCAFVTLFEPFLSQVIKPKSYYEPAPV